jgi:hypothetical protein
MPNLDEIREYRKKAQDEAVKVNIKRMQDTCKAGHTVVYENGEAFIRKDTIELNLDNYMANPEK